MRVLLSVVAVALASGLAFRVVSFRAAAVQVRDSLLQENSAGLLSPQNTYDAQAIAVMLQREAARRELDLEDLRVHVGAATQVNILGLESIANEVTYEFTAVSRSTLPLLGRRHLEGLIKVPVSSGPRDWPLP